VVAQAAIERQSGGTLCDAIQLLSSDPTDSLAVALARLGRGVLAANP